MRGPCTVNLFAFSQTSNIFQLEIGSRRESSGCTNTSWNNIRGYAFPPFCLIGRYLTKFRSEKVPWVLLITLLWKSQTWFPLLPEMSVKPPIPLLSNNNLSTDRCGNPHPMIVQGHLQLVAWTVSEIPYKVEAFHKAISFLCALWRSNTKSSYSSSWRIWEKWCSSGRVNPLCSYIFRERLDSLQINSTRGRSTAP